MSNLLRTSSSCRLALLILHLGNVLHNRQYKCTCHKPLRKKNVNRCKARAWSTNKWHREVGCHKHGAQRSSKSIPRKWSCCKKCLLYKFKLRMDTWTAYLWHPFQRSSKLKVETSSCIKELLLQSGATICSRAYKIHDYGKTAENRIMED